MLSHHHLCGLAALVLALAAATGPGAAMPRVPTAELPGTSPDAGHRPVVPAQMADPRVMNLEEEVRRLKGLVEELNFQMLQMQDQLRRMQEDTEFRFQELEGTADGGSEGAGDQRTRLQEPAPAGQPSVGEGQAGNTPPGTETARRGEPPRVLGTITLDENGNVVSSGTGQPMDLLQGTPVDGDGSVVAALPPSDNPDDIYRNAYDFILSGDYKMAEAGFRQYLQQHPDGEHVADAQFWMGEAILGQDRYREAAEVFLQANRTYPDAEKAPDMLLKLGVSLAALNQRDVACATYREIGQRYPNISSALKERVKEEQALAGC